jgi:hypothetical protein
MRTYLGGTLLAIVTLGALRRLRVTGTACH